MSPHLTQIVSPFLEAESHQIVEWCRNLIGNTAKQFETELIKKNQHGLREAQIITALCITLIRQDDDPTSVIRSPELEKLDDSAFEATLLKRITAMKKRQRKLPKEPVVFEHPGNNERVSYKYYKVALLSHR